MTAAEVTALYNIPPALLKAYELWDLDGKNNIDGTRDYDEKDIKSLGAALSLYHCGFTVDELEVYMKYRNVGDSTASLRLKMLSELRHRILEDIHKKERQIATIDNVRSDISARVRRNDQKNTHI